MTPQPRGKARTPDLFLNRELSWLEFNARVLEEACDAAVPLLERLKFAVITASNLDEFFMVRVASLKHKVEEEDRGQDPAGLSPAQQLERIAARAHAMVATLAETLHQDILPGLAARGARLARPDELEPAAQAWLARMFREQIEPALTPLAIDASRPFPMLAGLSLNLAVLLEPETEGGEPRLAVVQLPARVPRLLRLAEEGGWRHVLLEEALRAGLKSLFPGQAIRATAVFRVTRDAEMELDDEGGRPYVETLEEELRQRRRGGVVRLEIEDGADPTLVETIVGLLGVGQDDIYRMAPPLDVRALAPLADAPALDDLRDPPMKPVPPADLRPGSDIFAVLDERDLLLHHPYDSFDPVVALVSRAAEDPDVLAIKQTLYRTSGDSPVIGALVRAAEAGKQVTVLIEVLARFDEWSNIRWAHELERAGAHVLYGVRGYKTHAKILLIVRRTAQGIQRYVHMATGNYNDRTARLYTDLGLMTTDRDIGADASAFFNALTGYSDPPVMKKLAMAPTRLRERLLGLIDRERLRAEQGQAAEIIAKMNSLVDEEIIRALYAAAAAGVGIRLNVRGICCLRPGARGLSENIEVVSIIDRFLEHSRVFFFRNGGDEEVYLSSADWMPRNLDKRIELLFPVESPACRAKMRRVLDAMFRDTVKARVLQPDGSWRRRRTPKGEDPFRVQVELHREAIEDLKRASREEGIVLEPILEPGPARGGASAARGGGPA